MSKLVIEDLEITEDGAIKISLKHPKGTLTYMWVTRDKEVWKNVERLISNRFTQEQEGSGIGPYTPPRESTYGGL